MLHIRTHVGTMFPMKERKEVRVAVRITPQLRTRIDNAVESTGVPEAVVVTKCLEAYCDYVEQQGEITFPLIVKPKSKEEAQAKQSSKAA